MKQWLPLLLMLAAMYVAFRAIEALRNSGRRVDRAPCPFRKRDYLLSIAERSFFEVLLVAVAGQFHVFAKVRLEDLLYLPKGTLRRQAWLNRVRQKHVDFVLCDRLKVAPLLIIELDDPSHERADRQERDAFVDLVLKAAGLPILHVPAQRTYSTRAIADLIADKLSRSTSNSQ